MEAVVILLGAFFIGSMMPTLADIAFFNSSPEIADSSFAMDNSIFNPPELNNNSAINNESIKAAMVELPLSFIENRGQASEDVKFMIKMAGQTVFFTADEVVFALSSGNNSSVVRMSFEGSNSMKIIGEDPFSGKANFFIGNDSSKWLNDIPTFGEIRYKELYPGVDLVFKGTKGYLKHEFVVSPSADISQIVLAYNGQENLSLADDGSLLIRTATGNLTDSAPVCYQEFDGDKIIVEGKYRLVKDQRIGFEIGSYDRRHPLVIDPSLFYSTYLGGSSVDIGEAIAVDSSGNAYVTGGTSSANFPTQNPIQASNAGYSDAFVAKINSAGSALIYSTYLGGSGREESYRNLEIAVDSSGNAYVTGNTNSTNFPTQNPIQASNAGYNDAFVAKINSAGSALIYSTYLGGSGDDYAMGIAVDSSGNAYVTGETNSTNFQTQNPIQASKSGYNDAFVTKINSAGSALIYSTYLGGNNNDVGEAIAVDTSGNAYVTGGTASGGCSADFPTQNPIQASNAGNFDAFVTKINSGGSALIYSTHLGGNDRDQGMGIAVDTSGNAYVTGHTDSNNFPTQNPIQASNVGYFDAFVTKINSAGSVLIYSTYLGGNGNEFVKAIAVDSSGNAYATGFTNSTNFLTQNPIQALNAGYNDAFVTKINSAGSALIYSTYLGGSGKEDSWGIAVDSNGKAYITGYTDSNNFPIKNSMLSAYTGNDAFVAVLTSSNPIDNNINIDEASSESWIDPYSSSTDDKEAVIWYEIAPNDFSGQLEIEIKDTTGKSWNVGPISISGGRHSLTWDGRISNDYVNQANNPYQISLILQKDGQVVKRSTYHKIWVGRPVILLHGIFSSKEEMEKTTLYRELRESFYISSVEYDGGIIGSSTGDIKQYAGKLSNEIISIKKYTGAKKVDIVAHSMGGLVARYHIQMNKAGETGDVGKLIMIGTPNHGSDFANLPRATLKALIKILDERGLSSLGYSIDTVVDQVTSNFAINEMVPHHNFLINLNGNDCCAYKIENSDECKDKISETCQYIVIISEPTWIPTLAHGHGYINIFGYKRPIGFWVTKGDRIVPFSSAKLSNVDISSEGGSLHNNQANSQEITSKVISLLKLPTLAQGRTILFKDNELDENSTPTYWTNPIEDVIYPGDERSYNIWVDQSSIRAHFMLVWDNGTLNVTLSSPNGSEIEMPSNGNVAYYSVQNPDTGNWTAEILSTSIPTNGTNITIQAFIENPLFIGVNTDKTVFDPQEPINITAYLGDNQSGFTGALVVASVSKPDNRTETLTLYDDGLHNDNGTADGIYANQYMNTSLWGTYRILISASGNLDGNDFERQIITTVWVELYPDLTLNISDIHFSNTSPISGENISITAEIRNIGDADAGNSSILFYDNDPSSGVLIGEDVINIGKGSFEKAEVFWNATPGQHEIYIWISPYNSFFELNYSNNMANKSIYVSNPYISGTKFNDSNSNATRDPGEAGLPGWTIRLTRPDGTSINATTDANGGYKFENLTSGTYRVSEIRQSNWTQTYPAWLGDHIINVTDGNVTGVDFGNNYLPVPEIPFPPSGPVSGIPGVQYSYSTSSTDPSGYQISCTFDWGDGSNSTTGLFDSGALASAAHIWNSSGIYQVRAMATNSKGASSGWSDPLVISIANPILGWKALGGVITSSPSAIIDNQDQTEVWVKGGDNALWLNIDGSWQGKGGYLTSDPFAVEDYNGRIHVLARGGDNGAWDFIYDPVTQSGEWIGLGGYITEGLTAAKDPANHNLMRVAARGGDEALWTCDLDINAKSSSWSFQGGVLTSRPYIIFDPSGSEHILLRGGDNALWDRNGEWTGSSYTRTWSPLGGILANSPVATIEPGADSRIAVFVKGGDDAIWMCDVDSSSETETGSWHRLGGVISSDIFAVADSSGGKIHSFARGSDMALWENAFTTSPWNPDGGQWKYLGGSILDYRPGATLTGTIQAFVIGTDNGLWQNTQATASATAGDARSCKSEAEMEIQSSITDQDRRMQRPN